MSAVAQPRLPAGPLQDLLAEAHALYRRAGSPGLRGLGHRTGLRRASIASVLSTGETPVWEDLEALVTGLGGDVEEFRSLWQAAAVPQPPVAAVPDLPEPPAAAGAMPPAPPPRPGSVRPGFAHVGPVPRHRSPLPVDFRPGVELPPGWRGPEHLPPLPRPFVGRAGERAVLDTAQLVPNPSGQTMVLVSGPPGTGKTALAVHWTRQRAAQEPVLHLDLRGTAPEGPLHPAAALGALLALVGLGGRSLPRDLTALARLWRACVADRPLVLVLDDASSAEQVRHLVPGSPTSTVVVTSRDGLPDLVREYGALRLDLSPLSRPDAVGLLERLVGARCREDPASTAALVALAAGVPRALRLLAEHARERPEEPVAVLVAELDLAVDRLDLSARSTPLETVERALSRLAADRDAHRPAGMR